MKQGRSWRIKRWGKGSCEEKEKDRGMSMRGSRKMERRMDEEEREHEDRVTL